MSRWEKTCRHFKQVREAIQEQAETVDQCIEILRLMESCCQEISPDHESDWDFFEEFRDLKSEIHEQIEMLDGEDYDACEDAVDFYLNELYDLCDNANVWLDL